MVEKFVVAAFFVIVLLVLMPAYALCGPEPPVPLGKGVVLPTESKLRQAGGDRLELERLGRRLGPRRLLSLCQGASSDGHKVLYLRALGYVGEADATMAAQGLLPLVQYLRQIPVPGGASPVFVAGAEAAKRLCQRLTRGIPEGQEDLRDEILAASDLLLLTALETKLPSEARADLVEAAMELPVGESKRTQRDEILLKLLTAQVSPVAETAALALVRGRSIKTDAEVDAFLNHPGLVQPKDQILAACALCEWLPKGAPPPLVERTLSKVRLLAQGPALPADKGLLSPCLRRLGGKGDIALSVTLQKSAHKGRSSKQP